jgi:carbamate kinase
LPAGSMAPKVAAAAAFAERGGRAAIGALGDAAAILSGAAGTTIDPNAATVTYW